MFGLQITKRDYVAAAVGGSLVIVTQKLLKYRKAKKDKAAK
jgi:hypothetical protein